MSAMAKSAKYYTDSGANKIRKRQEVRSSIYDLRRALLIDPSYERATTFLALLASKLAVSSVEYSSALGFINRSIVIAPANESYIFNRAAEAGISRFQDYVGRWPPSLPGT